MTIKNLPSRTDLPALVLCLGSLIGLGACADPGQPEHTNRLARESSPYLLQHAHNPVDWYPWGEEALEKTDREDKLLIVSIGYAACHWCHVMERESFMDEEVAELMNTHFVSVKVDREERPDVDEVYLAACQLSSRQCGWPLNAIALPDGRPIWTGTYLPKAEWLKVLRFFADAWPQDKKKMTSFANQLVDGMAALYPDLRAGDMPEREVAERLREELLRESDPERGGRRGSPRFPMPAVASFLLHEYTLSNDPEAFRQVETQLQHLARGGLNDQLAGGFARYSTDAEWRVPHFEKMLYDNAQLARLYAEAYQLTGRPAYMTTGRATLRWTIEALGQPEGGYFSSLDADSEGGEGRYYTWTRDQWQAALPDAPEWLATYFGLEDGGNFEEGRNVLYRPVSLEDLSEEAGLSVPEARLQVEQARQALLEARNRRPPPATDDKVITAWNGLMIEALCRAYRAFDEPEWKERAIRDGEFIWSRLWHPEKGLYRIYKDGKASTPAFLDDYALLAGAYLGLYEITFDPVWVDRAEVLTSRVMANFRQGDSPLFYYTPHRQKQLVVRPVKTRDNVIPSSNSALARLLFRLGLLLDRKAYTQRARDMLSAALMQLETDKDPFSFPNWGELLLELTHPFYELAIVGPEAESARVALQKEYLPQSLFLGGTGEGRLPLLANKQVEGKTLIYVCLDKVCKMPVEDPDQALLQLRD